MRDKYWIEYLKRKSQSNYDDYLEGQLAERDRRIKELEAVAEEAMACRLFLSDTYHGEEMDRALRAAGYLK